jgi:hypothetical protein
MLPSFTPSEFWTTSLSYFLIRVSLMTLGMTAGWLWLRGRTPAFSPMLIFGRSSLFVYWVHVEIVYGSVSIPWHRALPVSQSVPALIVFTAATVGVTHLWSHRRRPLVPDYLKADAVPSEFPGRPRAGFA